MTRASAAVLLVRPSSRITPLLGEVSDSKGTHGVPVAGGTGRFFATSGTILGDGASNGVFVLNIHSSTVFDPGDGKLITDLPPGGNRIIQQEMVATLRIGAAVVEPPPSTGGGWPSGVAETFSVLVIEQDATAR